MSKLCKGALDALNFSLLQALTGRRSRRFGVGMEIQDSVFAYKSAEPPQPLSELETMMLLTACAGNTGWNFLIPKDTVCGDKLQTWAGAAGGRTYPSAGGVISSDIFFTNDDGCYFFNTRDMAATINKPITTEEQLQDWLDIHKKQITKIEEGRLQIPRRLPYFETHNLWVGNQAGTTLFIPVADMAQQMLNNIWCAVESHYVIHDDYHGNSIPGMEQWPHLVDLNKKFPLSQLEQLTVSGASAELATSAYAGHLMEQAMGLGGWAFHAISIFAVYGVVNDPECRGLGFKADYNSAWPTPNPLGRPGVFEAMTQPNYPSMRAAVDKLAERKYGPGGPFNVDTAGPWKNNRKIRAAAEQHHEDFLACVAHIAQYIYDTYGRFPPRTPSVFSVLYLQAQHIELGYYDQYFNENAVLETHRMHQKNWHSEKP